ncbi:MAG TPA: hypothetical protein VFB32_11175 [Rudaea sp.]|nr:hypothetical protein [Rudaea sp.]
MARRKSPDEIIAQRLSDFAKLLRMQAHVEHKDRRLYGVSSSTLYLSADILDALASGDDASKIIDGRKGKKAFYIAIEAIHQAAFKGAASWDDAIMDAAVELEKDPRTLQRHWSAFLKERNIEEENYLFPSGPEAGRQSRRGR